MSLQRKRQGRSPSNTSAVKKSRHCSTLDSSQFTQELEEAIVQRSGKILRMRLTNFMCHSNMIFEFNQRMNFLVGSNGSGKSAVMAALALGLGCKATATNRCTSFKNFIKSGENFAEVEIVICNAGLDAYEKEIYGKTITVIRNLKISGSSSYLMKSENGVKVSTKVAELHRITNYLNIQADNPIFVLSQDNARSFLRNMNDHKNYDIYMKATQIETILQNVNECLIDYESLKFSWKCKKKELNNLKNDVDELHKKYIQLQTVETLKTQIIELNFEKMWSTVFEQEDALDDVRKRLEDLVEEQNELKYERDNKEAAEASIRDKIKSAEIAIADVQNSIQSANQDFQNVKALYIKEDEICQMESRKLDKLKSRKELLKGELTQLENHIEQQSASTVEFTQNRREQNEAELVNLKKHKTEIEAMIVSTKQEIEMLTNTRINKEMVFEELNQKRRDLVDRNKQLQSQISSTRASSKDQLGIYGEHVTRFISSLQKAYDQGRFSELPRGPLGRYIEVPNEKYRAIVEQQMQGLISSFLINNAQDRTVFDSILKREFPSYKPPVITTKFFFEVYDVRKGMVEPPRGTRLLMKELKCSDNVVLNCLIDRARIETVLITEQKATAEYLTSKASNVPRNLYKVLLIDPSIEYYPEPAYRMYSLNLKPARYIQVNMEERIVQMEEELEEKKRYLDGYHSKLNSMKDDLKIIYQEKAKKDRVMEKHETTKKDINDKIQEIENIEYPSSRELEILSNELVQLQAKSEKYSEDIEKASEVLKEHLKSKDDYQFKVDKNRKKITEIENRIGVLKDEHNNSKLKLNNLLTSSRHNESKLKEVDKNYYEYKIEEERERHKLEMLTSSAEAESDRPQQTRPEKQLTQLIRKLEKRVELTIANEEDVEEINAKYKRKSKQYDADKQFVDQIHISIGKMKESMDKRFLNINMLKNHTSIYMKFGFSKCLERREYTGDLSIDHDKKTLHISVIPRDKNVEGAVSSTKSLSGGERSYSTLAFLVSLWSCVDHPFYFLDEYDVFTDEVNREVMTRLLINEGTKYAHRQYTFLTPQEMSLKATDMITLHRLSKR